MTQPCLRSWNEKTTCERSTSIVINCHNVIGLDAHTMANIQDHIIGENYESIR